MNPTPFPPNFERLAGAVLALECVTDTPRLDAEILLACALGITRTKLLASLNERADAPGFDGFVERRRASEPIAYILGEWEFYSLGFKVVPPLLVPRPETEHLVEAVLEHMGRECARVFDVGTGTGCVAVAIAHAASNCCVTATDINPLALDIAAENARRHDVAGRIVFRLGDLFDALECDETPFDIICSNPPYIEEAAWPGLPPVVRCYEDPGALLAGEDGIDVIRRLAAGAQHFLRPGGWLMLEIGMGQYPGVADLLAACGYEAVSFRRDLAGIERIAIARRRPR